MRSNPGFLSGSQEKPSRIPGTPLLSLVAGALFFALAACGGSSSSGAAADPNGPISTNDVTATLRVSDYGTPERAASTHLGFAVFSVTRSFEMPADGVSFVISVFGNDFAAVEALVTPGGVNLLQAGSLSQYFGLPLQPDFTQAGDPFTAVYSNRTPGAAPPEAGTWQFTVNAETNNTVNPVGFKLSMRTGTASAGTVPPGTVPPGSTLAVRPFLTGTAFSAADVAAGLQVFKTILENAGFTVILDTVVVVGSARFATVNANFEDADTAALLAMGAADKINLFFVEDIIAFGGGGILGVASGIPGAPGIVGNRNGVLNGLGNHLVSGVLDDDLLGETLAHEMGHWLGLNHTTEADGTAFDLLGDTPQCPASNDADGDGQVSAPECAALGGNYLMFWAGGPLGFRQSIISPQQVSVIDYFPIAR